MDIKKIMFSLAIMSVMVGCTSAPTAMIPIETTSAQPATSTPPGAYKFTIATGADLYDEGNGLSAEINTQIPVVFSSIKKTESLMENVDLLTSGRSGLAFVYDYHITLANQGKLMSAFPDAPTEKITIKCGTEMIRPMFPDYAEAARIILPLYEEQLLIVVLEASGISTVNELKEKHIATGEAGSATEQQARFVLTGLGIDWERGIIHKQYGLSAAVQALESGEIDALFWSGNSSNTELSDLLNMLEAEFKLIPITRDDAERIIQANPGIFHKSNIQAETYRSNPEAIDTLATTVVLAAMEDFPEEYALQIVTVFFDPTSADWKSRFPFTPEASIALLNAESQPYLHQGTETYLTEQGILK